MTQYSIYFVIVGLLLVIATAGFAEELRTRYANVSYEREKQLLEFNHRISIKRLSDLKKSSGLLTVEDEVRYKLDSLVEKIELLLHVCPRELKFDIKLVNTSDDVQEYYKNKYGIKPDYVAFYSRQNKMVFISVNDIRNSVLAHELTHVIVDQYFTNTPSPVIQEILAHFVETHIDY